MNGRQATLLDVIRVLASQMVLVSHLYGILIGRIPFMLGNLGVLVFFVLSGFLICHSALEKRARDPGYGMRLFFYDRFFRIFVAFVPALVAVLVLDYALLRHRGTYDYEKYFTVKNFVGTLLMVAQNPAGLFADQLLHLPQLKISTFGSSRPFWTVTVEWWLYMFFGWMVLRAGTARRSPWGYLGVLALVGVVPLFNAVAGTGEGLTILWFASAGFAWLYLRYRSQIRGATERFGGAIVAGTLAILAGLMGMRVLWVSYVLPGFHWQEYPFYDTTFGILFVLAFFVVFLAFEGGEGGERSRVVKFLSDYSYSLYLIHYSLIVCLQGFEVRVGPPWMTATVYFVACNLAGILLWWLFERHYPTLKRAWLARARGERGTPAGPPLPGS